LKCEEKQELQAKLDVKQIELEQANEQIQVSATGIL
jgi:hypothetical protein